jgi:hypothetical protein
MALPEWWDWEMQSWIVVVEPDSDNEVLVIISVFLADEP